MQQIDILTLLPTFEVMILANISHVILAGTSGKENMDHCQKEATAEK